MTNPESINQPRYIVGIDLGTTNCAVAFVDTRNDGRKVVDFPIRQFTAAGVTEQRDTLPSFLYALLAHESSEADQAVDATYRVGMAARDHGALTPGRLISSAKSWLCHDGIDRKSAMLPWHAIEGVQQISPLQAQSIILRHLIQSWNEAHPDQPLAQQEVYITVPASFDEVARELTIEAAKLAGLPALILLEEPQAAFYAWLAHHETTWTETIAPDDHILICDIGGGTTDFTLIHARPDDNGTVVFHRTAVGDHLILGGDNLDLALAHHLEPRLAAGGKLDSRAWAMLVRQCRHYKETLLSETAPDSIEVIVPGAGSGILLQQRHTTLTRAETEQLLLEGFMPKVEAISTPARRISGFQEFGLPFTADAAITRYLAEFLRNNLPRDTDGNLRPPQAILLNGGLFESAAMRRRFCEVLRHWFTTTSPANWQPVLLDHRRLDLAVARGAAYFGLARRGRGIRVISNLARSYYLGVDTGDHAHARRAICLAPASLASGQTIRISEHPLKVRLKSPVEFHLYVSSRRTTDPAGAVVDIETETFTPMPPVRTVLSTGKQATATMIDVHLTANLSELGTLDLGIVEATGLRSWKLAFDLRAATRTELTYHDGQAERTGFLETERVEQAAAALRSYFQRSPADVHAFPIMKEIEGLLERSRRDWPVSVLRKLWETSMDIADIRKQSATHEQRWLNMLGYSLRPGFGFALDDWRVAETWKLYHGGLHHAGHDAVRAEWWILWRRIAGGLHQGQQTALASPLLAALKQLVGGKPKVRMPGGWESRLADHETIEWLRLLSSLERLSRQQRQGLGESLLQRIMDKGFGVDRGAAVWAIGRIGSRQPLYGPINQLVEAETVIAWLNKLMTLKSPNRDLQFTVMQLARCTGDRYRDIDDTSRNAALLYLKTNAAPDHWQDLVRQAGHLDQAEQEHLLGDSLPIGIQMD